MLAVLFHAGPLVPVGFVVGALVLLRTMSQPRFGLVASLVLALVIPLPLAFGVGPFNLTFARIVGYAFLVGWVACLSRPDGPLFRRTSLDWAFALLMFSFLLSMTVNSPSLGGLDFRAALQSTGVTFLDQVVFFYAAVSIMGAGHRHVDRVLRIASLVVAGIALVGIFEWLTGRNIFTVLGPAFPSGLRAKINAIAGTAGEAHQRGAFRRAIGTFEGPNQFGAAVVLAIPFLLHYWSVTKRQRYGFGALACTFAALTTVSRSAFIGLVVVVVVYAVAAGAVQLNRARVVAVCAVVLIVAVTNPSLRATMSFYLRDVTGGQQSTIQGRLVDYENVGRQFVRSPLAGSGPSTWRQAALRRPNNGKVEDPSSRAQVVLDNVFLGALAQQGAVGLAGILAVLFGAIGLAARGVRRATTDVDRSLRAALLAAVCLFALLCAFFDMFAFYGPTRLYIVLLAAMVVEVGATRVVIPRRALAADRS